MSPPKSSHYSFGDLGPAGERLRRLAELYRPTSTAALRDAMQCLGVPVRTALDLGSGPGHTTELVAQVTGATRTVGVERSAHFCAEARARVGPRIEFVEHDLGGSAPPNVQADLAFCRFLLTHLDEPVPALRAWRGALTPDGVLVLVELERLESSDPALALYYRIVEGVQGSHGQSMFIGRRLDALLEEAGYEIRSARSVSPNVPASAMATLHRANLENLRQDPWVTQRFAAAAIDELAGRLEALAAGRPAVVPLENVLRQVVATPRSGSDQAPPPSRREAERTARTSVPAGAARHQDDQSSRKSPYRFPWFRLFLAARSMGIRSGISCWPARGRGRLGASFDPAPAGTSEDPSEAVPDLGNERVVDARVVGRAIGVAVAPRPVASAHPRARGDVRECLVAPSADAGRDVHRRSAGSA